jgi:hypothetical protein
MTIEMSAAIAASAATSYEKTSIDGGGPHNATVMDMENNQQGRTIAGGLGADPNRTDCQNAVIDALNDGTLTILDDLTNPNEEGLLKPSDE